MGVDLNQKYWKWLIPLLCAVYCLLEIGGRGDFYIFLSAAGDLASHENIFEKKYVDGYHYYYSVLFAIFLSPMVHLPYLTVKFFWLLLNALLFFDLLRMLFRSEQVVNLGEKKRTLFVLLVFIVSLRFFTDNIHTSQITILILWCCIRGIGYIAAGRPLTGALLLAIGINIKLLPLVFIPYLIYRGFWKEAVLTILICTAFLFVPSLIVGHTYNMELLSTWASLINPSNQIHVLDVDERSFHGLSTLLSTLLVKDVPDVYALKIPRNIADVPLGTLSKAILVTRLTLVAFTLYFLVKAGTKKMLGFFSGAVSGTGMCLETSYILLIIPLIFPHQQHYAFLFAMPAFAMILYAHMRKKIKNRTVTVLLIVIAVTFNLKLVLGSLNHYYDHFKIITYAALLLIPLLVWAAAQKEIISRPEED